MEILFSDKNIIVCVKPVGVESEKEVPALLKEEFSGEIYTLHRLDLNVGGVMVYARNKQTAAHLSRCIQENTMIKEYLAMVHGEMQDEKGVMEDFLFKDSRKNKVFTVKKERKGVKKAKLEYDVLWKEENTLVHIRLHTGRSHQIRVQFASRGYPLIGDHKYGSKDACKTPMLYSCKISFPYQGKNVSFTSTPSWANEKTNA